MKEGRVEVLKLEKERKRWRQTCPECGEKLEKRDPYEFGVGNETQGDLPSADIEELVEGYGVQVYACPHCSDPEFLIFPNGDVYNYRGVWEIL